MTTHQPERPTCATCPYWERRTIPGIEHQGLCVRFPPTLSDAALQDRNKKVGVFEAIDDEWYWSQPVTEEDGMCGEHPDFPAWIAATRGK